jgi:hypothetical protein
MPTILLVRGWRLFFYADEGKEPVHIHARKGDAECKFWLYPDTYQIEEAWAYNLTPRLRREVRRIVFENLELLTDEWNRFFRKTDDANQ